LCLLHLLPYICTYYCSSYRYVRVYVGHTNSCRAISAVVGAEIGGFGDRTKRVPDVLYVLSSLLLCAFHSSPKIKLFLASNRPRLKPEKSLKNPHCLRPTT
ncbi:unnamed protein product, partial [Laminaria digitata]